MSTINHVRLAQQSPVFARECERGHAHRPEGHAYGTPSQPTVDPYTRRSNICASCRTTRAVNGACLCD